MQLYYYYTINLLNKKAVGDLQIRHLKINMSRQFRNVIPRKLINVKFVIGGQAIRGN